MRKAARRGDPTKKLIPIADWLVKHRRDTPYCVICGHDLRIDGELSKKVVTHFSHSIGANCPTTAKAGKPYDMFKDTERVSSAEARKVKQYALDNIESIYERCRSLCPDLTWLEFFPLLERATELNAWAFKDFDRFYIPYLLLCCADVIPPNKKNRPHPLFFVLEPGAHKAEFWHQPESEKQRIWRVDAMTLAVVDIAMDLKEVVPWHRRKATAALGL